MSSVLGLLLSIVCGFVPMFFLAGIIFWLDRYEKEPKPLLAGVFAWGAVIAVIGALIMQLALGEGVRMLTGSRAIEEVMGSSLFAPVTEEILKGAAVLLVFLLFHNEFDSILDGIVYAAIVALGFAATEDVLYYFSSYTNCGLSAMMTVVFLRFIVFGWQHAFFTSFIGIGLALARLNRGLLVKLGAPLAGLGIAVVVHSLHNSLLTFLSGMVGLVAAAFVAWTGWVVMFVFIAYLIYREKAWLTEYLHEEVALQTITPEQYQMTCSFFGQTRARFTALTEGRYRATARFFQVCGELSHKKRQLKTLGEEKDNSRIIETLRAELSHLSPGV